MELKPEKEQKALGQRKQKKQKQQKKKQKKMGQRHLQAGVPLISGLNCCLTTTGTNTWEEVRMGWSEKGAEGNEPGGTAGGQERKRRGRLQTDHGRPFIQGSRIRIRHISFSVFAES